jgi:hypothetical protein
MLSSVISFGQAASQEPMLAQLPKPAADSILFVFLFPQLPSCDWQGSLPIKTHESEYMSPEVR